MAVIRKLKQQKGCGLVAKGMAAPSPLLATLPAARLGVPLATLPSDRPDLLSISPVKEGDMSDNFAYCLPGGHGGLLLARPQVSEYLGAGFSSWMGGFSRGTAIQQVLSLPGR